MSDGIKTTLLGLSKPPVIPTNIALSLLAAVHGESFFDILTLSLRVRLGVRFMLCDPLAFIIKFSSLSALLLRRETLSLSNRVRARHSEEHLTERRVNQEIKLFNKRSAT